MHEDFGSGENSQQFNFLLTRGRPKVESRIVSMRMGSSRQLRPSNRGCRYNALSQAPAAGYHSSFVPARSSRCMRASLSLTHHWWGWLWLALAWMPNTSAYTCYNHTQKKLALKLHITSATRTRTRGPDVSRSRALKEANRGRQGSIRIQR